MYEMCVRGDLRDLSAERVWQELLKALRSTDPARFFVVLDACGGLDDWFPECRARVAAIAALWARVGERASTPLERFGVLGWCMAAGDLDAMAARLRAPNEFRRLAVEVARHGRDLVRWRELPGDVLLALGRPLGMLRQPEWFDCVVSVVGICAEVDLRALAAAAGRVRAVASERLAAQGLSGPALGHALDADRARVLDAARTD
jgi:tRNA nucleotidyltransferase (CCA-adding enzyme)